MIDEKPISPRAYSLISTFTLVANNLFADYFFASNSVTKSRSFASIEGDFFVASAKKRRYLLLAFAYKLCNNRDCVVGRKISKQTSMQSSTPTMHHTKDMYDRHTRLYLHSERQVNSVRQFNGGAIQQTRGLDQNILWI